MVILITNDDGINAKGLLHQRKISITPINLDLGSQVLEEYANYFKALS